MEQTPFNTTVQAYLQQRKRRRLYSTLLALWIGGVVWIALCMADFKASWWQGCLIHQFLHIPCPACGTTRAVMALFQGHPGVAFSYNPLGFLIAPFMLILPFWILFDVIKHSSSLLTLYEHAEEWIARPLPASFAIMLMLWNWVWNITKY